VISHDGAKRLDATAHASLPSPFGRGGVGEDGVWAVAAQLGRRVAQTLLAQGAGELIANSRRR
jgi:hypothetical protein